MRVRRRRLIAGFIAVGLILTSQRPLVSLASRQSDRAVTVTAERFSFTPSEIRMKADEAIDIRVRRVETFERNGTPGTRALLEWKAARRSRLFPLMNAVLTIYPLTSTETQLDFAGRYRPPFGALGKVVNAAVGHRIAEACVHRFVADVAHHLRAELTGS